MAGDAQDVLRLTASQDAATNGVTFPVIVSKARLVAASPSTVVTTALIFDALTATGTAKIRLSTHLFAAALASGVDEVSFDPPVAFDKGISTTIAGSSGLSLDIYYKRV